MSIKNWSKLILLSMLLSSCATNYEDEKKVLLEKNESTDLVTAFEANAEQEEILSTPEPVVETKKETVKKVTTTKTTVTTTKPAENSKDQPAQEKKVTTTTVVTKETPVAPKENGYSVENLFTKKKPADYPAEYLAYDKKSEEVWRAFKPIFYKGEQSIMAITYLGVTAGYVTIQSKNLVTLDNKQAFQFYARFKSSDSYRYFYWLDDKLESIVDRRNFLPMKYTLIQREKKQDVDDLQLFDFNKMMTHHWYKRIKEGQTKESKVEKMIPSLAQDSFSALQMVRGLPLKKGDVYEFPVITRGKFWLLKAEVLGEETITVLNKQERAIKIKAETNFPGVLEKNGDILFWYGADTQRRLLRFQAKVKIGSLKGELVEFTPGTKVE